MRRSGWDARRRNRNIGTAKAGRGQDNQMTLPDKWMGVKWTQFHERLNNPVSLQRSIHGHDITFLVEPVQPGFFHACTPADIVKILELLPQKHIEGIDLIVLRQPKRKERILEPVWGRLRYWVEIQQYSGAAIYLEANRADSVNHWSKSLSSDSVQELERLIEDGHQVTSESRQYVIQMTADSIRTTQLYRTLPHEVGHYVDYLLSTDEEGSDDLFWSKPSKDKEDFAHRYAREFVERERAAGNIPFQRQLDGAALLAEGLSVSWFTPHNDLDAADSQG
jgi:hypothetical protein